MTRSQAGFSLNSFTDEQTVPLDALAGDTFPYHITTTGTTYSLEYAGTDIDTVRDRRGRYDSTSTTVKIAEFTDHTPTIYGLYTAPRTSEYGSANLDEIANANTRTLVNAYLSTFTGVMDNSESDWHKEINVAKAGQTIDHVQWKRDASAVAGSLLSQLIRAHPLPNTNHRSSLAFGSLYLHTLSESFWLPDTLTEQPALEEWIDAFIQTSKQYLTVRRNAGLFRWLADHNVQQVVRKNGIEIPLFEYDIMNHDLPEELDDRHEREAQMLVENLCRAADNPELTEKRDPGKEVFADRVGALDDDMPVLLGEALSGFRD